METPPPPSFVQFLQTIVQAQIHTDRFKAQLFYFSPEEILTHFESNANNNQKVEKVENKSSCESKSKLNLITLDSIVAFIQKHHQSQTYPNNSPDLYKVISKYFGFIQSTTSPADRFLLRLKPTDNKLILQVNKDSLQLQSSLSALFNSILSGYQIIKLKRQQCATNIQSILQYFHNQMGYYKGLTKQALKEITFQANIYGRISLSYLRQYIFGHDQEIIGWETLFGVKLNETIEKIEELSEENIASQNFILQDKSRVFTPKHNASQCPVNLTPDRQSICIQSVSEIKGIPETVSITKLSHPSNQDYTKALNQISQIETLLNKTKERYQKNRENLQNQTQAIRNQHLRRSQNIGKFSSGPKYSAKYEDLRINESRQKAVPLVDKNNQSQIKEVSNTSIWQNFSVIQRSQQRPESPYKTLQQCPSTLQQSIVYPILTKQLQRRQTIQSNDSYLNSSVASGQPTMRNRQAGKIRRSVPKDAQKLSTLQQRYSENTFSNYGEYESVLLEIKRQESKFQKMVEDREKILYGRTSIKPQPKSILKVHRKSPSYSSLGGDFANRNQRDPKNFTFQNLPINGRCSEIMRQVQNVSNLNTSRISSKKRQQIVQKATSQARLRIQDIENRALKRIAKYDSEIQDKNLERTPSYLKIQAAQTSKTDTPKFKPMKQNTPAIIKSQKVPQKNFFLNDLLNERPALKLTNMSSIYEAKY